MQHLSVPDRFYVDFEDPTRKGSIDVGKPVDGLAVLSGSSNHSLCRFKSSRVRIATILRSLSILLACVAAFIVPARGRAQQTVSITGVATNYDSVKVRFLPVKGAKDYRIYDAKVPNTVKYAGVWHLFSPNGYLFQIDSNGLPIIPDALVVSIGSQTTPTEADVPALELEMNGLTPGVPYTLVVQAVDALGPVAACCMYNANNAAIVTCPAGCPGCKLGMNSCCTRDGKISTNGQGLATSNPNVLASASITVTPTGTAVLPSSPLASQVLFEPFTSGTITPTGTVDAPDGIETFSMQTAAATWEIRTEKADTDHTAVFLDNNHFMAVLFDGGTPSVSSALHVGHGALALSPTQTVDYSGRKILHLTAEIDSHFAPDSRRYADFRLTPANDPYLMLDGLTNQLNNTDTDLEVELNLGNIGVVQSLGPTPGDPNLLPLQQVIVGTAGGTTLYNDCYRPNLNLETNGYQNARGLDNRSRFDVFISDTHFAVYEDGVKITEHDFPTPLPFQQAKVYFAQYHYHDSLEVNELIQYTPWETYFINTFPASDERHWDNMGYEVLPANTNWATLAGQIQPPQFLPLAPITNSASFVGTDITTQGNWIGKYGSDGYNVVGDAIDYPPYASVSAAEEQEWTWSSSSSSVQSLEEVSVPGQRVGAWWYGYPGFTLDVNLTDGQTHQIAVYVPEGTPVETIQVLEANTGAFLSAKSVSTNTGSAYVIWQISGHVQLAISNVISPASFSAMSGIFFDPAVGSSPPLPVPTTLAFSPTSVTGGSSSTGTVTLSGAAPTGGLMMSLSSSAGIATVPSTVAVAAGSSSTTFTVTTSAVTANTTATITAAANGTSASGTLTVTAPVLVPSSIAFSPSNVVGGSSSTGTVTLTGAAPTGGLMVSLSSTTGASVPISVTVAAGSSSATFAVTTSAVTATTTSSITASANGKSASGTLTVSAPSIVLSSLAFSPSNVVGGSSSTGTVTLTGVAPTGGLMVSLSSTTGASVPISVTVAAGSSSATFAVTTSAVTATTTSSITASANGKSASGTLTVSAPSIVLSSLAFSPASAVKGKSTSLTVTLSGPAPTGGVVVALTNANPSYVTVPASVTLPAGSSSVTVTIATKSVKSTTTDTVTGSLNGTSKSATLTLTK